MESAAGQPRQENSKMTTRQGKHSKRSKFILMEILKYLKPIESSPRFGNAMIKFKGSWIWGS